MYEILNNESPRRIASQSLIAPVGCLCEDTVPTYWEDAGQDASWEDKLGVGAWSLEEPFLLLKSWRAAHSAQHMHNGVPEGSSRSLHVFLSRWLGIEQRSSGPCYGCLFSPLPGSCEKHQDKEVLECRRQLWGKMALIQLQFPIEMSRCIN